MTTARIAVFGASGFVGAALCERLYFGGSRTFVPIIHSSGNAGRVARLGVPLRSVDLLDADAVRACMQGCDIVVNCSRGDPQVMLKGLGNLTKAARSEKISKFVHLSSLAIYGRNPVSESETEAGSPSPQGNPYGVLKLKQDQMVLALHRAGVPSYLLCPGNIGGPFSPFLRALVDRLVAGPIPLVDGGRYPCNLVHVDNLCEAILSAIRSDTGAGARYFVNETRPVSWRELFDALAGRLGFTWSGLEVSHDDISAILREERRWPGLGDHIRAALSPEFRQGLAVLPVCRWFLQRASALFAGLPLARQEAIRARLSGPMRLTPASSMPPLTDPFVLVQARRYYHQPLLLAKTLSWKPPLDFEAGIDSTAAWLRFVRSC